jgi:uncharacterized protein DUF3891
MIIRPHGQSELAITQPDHAALAGDIMGAWRTDGLPASPRRGAILRAVAEHDSGWRTIDTAPLTDDATGRILDFMGVPETVRRGVWPSAIDALSGTPYAAALVAHHAAYVYARYRPERAWTPFFADMEALRDRYLRAAAPLTLADLLADYRFLRMGDLISLAFCMGGTETPANEWGYVIRRVDTRMIITPDPFAGDDVPFEIVARALPRIAFRSPAEVREAWVTAPVVMLHGIASGH